MSSQASNGSLFSIAANQQPFRLLELPPELLEILTSHNPPNLHFKSAVSNSSLNTSEAVLCTSNKTFHIRQQQTSNGVHLILPFLPTDLNLNNEIPEPGLTAISQCTSSLELSPLSPLSAAAHLASFLPLYLEPSDSTRSLPNYSTRSSLFSHTPMSEAECADVWISLTAFELPPTDTLPRRAFRPAPGVLLGAWTRLLQLCRAEGLDLTAPLQPTVLTSVLEDAEDEYPPELFSAILTRLRAPTHSSQPGEDDVTPPATTTATPQTTTLDKTSTIPWLGLLILQARLDTHPDLPRLDLPAFLTQWQDLLPEPWRASAVLGCLPQTSYVTVANYIRFRDPADALDDKDAGVAGDAVKMVKGGSGKGEAAGAGAGAVGKRKWHEKFAATRKQGKFGMR